MLVGFEARLHAIDPTSWKNANNGAAAAPSVMVSDGTTSVEAFWWHVLEKEG